MKGSGGALTPELRARFIAFRTALVQLGVYDPILGRFDSFTSPRATVAEIADELEKI